MRSEMSPGIVGMSDARTQHHHCIVSFPLGVGKTARGSHWSARIILSSDWLRGWCREPGTWRWVTTPAQHTDTGTQLWAENMISWWKYWHPIGQNGSRDLNTGLRLVSQHETHTDSEEYDLCELQWAAADESEDCKIINLCHTGFHKSESLCVCQKSNEPMLQQGSKCMWHALHGIMTFSGGNLKHILHR